MPIEIPEYTFKVTFDNREAIEFSIASQFGRNVAAVNALKKIADVGYEMKIKSLEFIG